MKILAVGDSFIPCHLFEIGLAELMGAGHRVRFIQVGRDASFTPATPSERALKEYEGHPQQLVDALTDEDVLLVHGAPVSEAVLDASPYLKIVGVARGGPVNVDRATADKRGIGLIIAPARNAEAVADLTLTFMVMLARGIMAGADFVRSGGRVGDSTFEGAQFFGHELGGHILGLVGYGNVGARVAKRAFTYGMSILVYDPYVAPAQVEAPGIAMTALEELLARSDFVSLHARATPETNDFFNAHKFSTMKRGAFFINTARETLVDETALYDALAAKHLAGAALDVLKPWPQETLHPLIALPNVIVTPHLGGATHEAALRGVQILAGQLAQYANGQAMRYLVNAEKAGRLR